MIRQIIFFVATDKEPSTIETPVLFFEWNGKSPVMNSAYKRLSEYMKEKFKNQEYIVIDWHWADKGT